MLWETLRGRPTTRGVYKERADRKPSSEAKRIWDGLNKSRDMRLKGNILTEPVVSSAFIGAQDTNAENVPFQGVVEQNFLLNFWPIVSLIFVPRTITRNEKTKQYQMDEAGFVLAVPEPAKLQDFVEQAISLLGKLEIEKSGFRPRYALITVPEESGLEYAYRLAGARAHQGEIKYSLAAVEIYHLEKRGHNITTLVSEHISPDEQILKDYDGLRENYHNPFFRSQRIKNLLKRVPWYTEMDSLFSQYPCEFFIFNQEKIQIYDTIPFFGYDARAMFKAIQSNVNSKKGGVFMSPEDLNERLAHCVHRLVREYVNRRTEEKSGAKYDEFKNKKDEKGHIVYPPKYREEREDVCSDAFLAMRSRREQDFREYFTGTICSVAQYLPEDDYLIVSQALINQPETVKTYSMLALSAQSAIGRTTKDEKIEGGE